MTCFTWLHITDFHSGMSQHKTLWNNMKDKFREDLAAFCDNHGSLDLVFFTGDLAYGGKTEEFIQVDKMLDNLWKHLEDKCKSKPKLLAVPGNHDLSRDCYKNPLYSEGISLLNRWNSLKDTERDDFFNNSNRTSRKAIDEAFSEYTKWWDNQSHRRPENITAGILPGDFSCSFEKEVSNGRVAKLGIIGLNTSFLHFDDREPGSLALDTRQLNGVCQDGGDTWARNHDACLLLTHHGPKWLHEDCRTNEFDENIYPSGRFAVHLHGHEHITDSTSYSSGGESLRSHWQGPALFGIEYKGRENRSDRLHGYSIGRLMLYPSKENNKRGNGKLIFWSRIARKQRSNDRVIVPDYSLRLKNVFPYLESHEFVLLREYNGLTPPLLEVNMDRCRELIRQIGEKHKKVKAWKELHEIIQVETTKFGVKKSTLCIINDQISKEFTKGKTDTNDLAALYRSFIGNFTDGTLDEVCRNLISNLDTENLPKDIVDLKGVLCKDFIGLINDMLKDDKNDKNDMLKNDDKCVNIIQNYLTNNPKVPVLSDDETKKQFFMSIHELMGHIYELSDCLNRFLKTVDSRLKEEVKSFEDNINELKINFDLRQ